MPRKRILLPLVVLAVFPALGGCTALPGMLPLALPVLVSGAGGGIAYTVTNVAYKTFSYPIEKVEAANRKALRKMGIVEVWRKVEDSNVEVKAETSKLTIYIDFEKITAATTKMKVNVKRALIFKDKATATEIIVQTGRFLEQDAAAPALLFVKGSGGGDETPGPLGL
ncbi:MAG TPA: DUF3568 family protein [Deltaproteobacteria bacterium]|nr:DUF3568 family protein [Deltaproteobacteria bacterium]